MQRFNFRGLAAGDSTYYRDEVVRVRVFFTQHVTVNTSGGEPYLDLTVGSTTRRAAYNSSRQNYLGFSYRVQADDFDGDGVSVPANGLKLNGARITAKDDTSANANIAHDSAAGGPSRKVDGSKHRPPEVRSVTFSNSPASGDTYGYGEKIEATVAFSHRVLATTTGGTPSLALTIGAHTRQAALTRAGRRTRLTFSYTVQAGDLAPAGASIAASAVRLNGGTITHDADTATHAALAHGAVAADSTRKVNGRQGRPPKVEGVAFAAPAPKDSVYWRGDTIAVRVGFDDSVAVNTTGGSPQVALTIGTATRQATFSANNGKTLVFEYVVQSGDRDADGVNIAANALALNGATIRGTGAAAARDADVTHPLVEASAARTVDGSKVRAPSIRSVAFAGSAPAGGTYHYDAEVRVEVVFDRSVVVDTARGSPRLALAVGAQRRYAAFAASAGTGTTLVFAYRVQSADMDSDGASINANALELNGGTIEAEADSTVAANLTHDGLAADLTRKVDGRPRITGLEFYHVGPPPPRGVYGYQERIWVLAHFDQKLELEQRVHLSIEVGTDTVRLRSRAQLRMADSAVAFYYIVTRDAVDTDGVRIPKGALTLSGGSLRAASDGATNARLDHDELPADSSWRVNGRLTPVPRPFVRFRGLPTNGSTYTRHERIRIGVSYTVGVVVTGTPELTLNLGTGTRQLAAVGSTLGGPVFEYVVQTGDVDEDGVGVSANALSLPNGATIRSAADTSVLASLTHDSLPASAVHKVDGRRVEAARVQWVSINPPPSRDSTYTRSETFYVNATFDRGVAVDTTGGRPRIALEIGDSTRYATYSHAHNSGPRYQVFMYVVQAGDRDADGLNIAANAMELNGGAITAPDDTVRADLSHGAVRPGAAYKVDGDRSDAPHVRWMWFHAPPSGDTFLRSDWVVLTVTFDRATAVDTVGGRPQIALQVGDSTRHATYLGPPGTWTSFNFGYVVQAGDRDADGLSIPANALELNGGKITAPGDTTAAVLTHDSLPTSPSHKVDGDRAGAARLLRVGISPPPSSDSTYTRGEMLDVNAYFDRDVAVDVTGGRPRLALEIGDSTRYATYSHAYSGTSSIHVFKYVVQAGDQDDDGLSIAANALELNGGAITAPNDTVRAKLSHGAVRPGAASKVDGNRSGAPHVRWMWFHGPASGDTYVRGERVVVTLAFDRATAVDTVGGRPRLALQVGDSTRYAYSNQAFGRPWQLVLEYVVQASDRDADGLSIAANALELNGAVITAPGDTTAAVLTHDSLPANAAHKVDGSRVRAARLLRMEISRRPSRDSTYTRGERLYVSASFDRDVAVDVTGGRPRLALEIGDSTRYATYSYAYGGPSFHLFTYVVQAGDRDADGVSIAANALDLNGGAITAVGDTVRAEMSNDAVAAGGAYKVDGDRSSAPHVRAMWFVAPASGDTFLRGERVAVRMEFDRATAVDTVGGRPRLALQVGDSTRHAYLNPAYGQPWQMEFDYVVQAGDRDADGLSIAANALSANGSTITMPGSTTAAVLTHDSVPTSPSHKVDGSRAGAARLLRVGISPPPSSDSTYTRGERLDVNAYFDRDVAVDVTGGRPRIALEIGDSTRYATYSHAYSGGSSLQVFKYVVQAGDRDTDGLSIAANALELNGGAITAPNDTVRAKLSHGAVRPGAASKVDGNRSGAPHVRWMWFHGPASGDTYVRGERVVVTLAFDRATAVDTVGGRPRLALQVGDSTRYAYSNQAFGRPWQLVLEYVVQASDRDADGLSIAANALELNGAVITAPGDTTAAVLTHDSLPANAAHKVDGSRVRAARLLRMEISRRPSRDSTYTRGERLYVSASFDRDVAVDVTGGRPRLALEIGDSTRYATYSYAYGGPSFHLFTYVVQAGDRDADGVSIAANALDLNGGAITAVGDTVRAEMSNDAVAAGGAYKVDGDRSSAPHVRAMWFVAPASGDTFLRGERVAVRMEFDRATAVDTVGGRPRLALQVGDSTRHAYLNPAYGQPWQMEFDYVVQAGDRDADGLSIAANALSANGSTITMPGSTTAAVLTHDSVPTSPSHKVDGSRTAGDAEPEENRAPEVVSAIAPMTMEVASPAVVVDLSAHFRDPDGDELRYFAVSASSRSVRADVAGSALTIAALAMGESLVTVRAADPDGAEAEQSFMVTVETSRADRARIMKRSLATFGRAVGTETVEAVGGRLGAADDGPGAAADEAHLQVGGRSLSCVGAGERCGLEELARQAAGVLGLRMSQGAGSLASALRAAAKGSHDAGALRGLAGVFGRPGQIGSTAGLGSAAGHGVGGFGATTDGATGPNASFTGRHGDRAGWGRLVSVDPVSREELLARSSFRFSPGADGGAQSTPGGWTFWGQASAGGFEGRPEDDLALDGTVRSAYLGADYRFGAGPLVGLALSRTTSSIGFESGINGTGAVHARLTSLYPYAQWSPRAGLSIWGLVGAGRGTAELSEDATRRDFATNIGMAMTAAGVRQRLTGVLAVKADAFAVRTDAEEARELAGVVANVQRLRLASEVGGRWGSSGGSAITSRVELGVRFDGGDAETGAGAEVGAGVGYVHDGIGLSVDARGRALVAHQASSLREWGASVAVRLQPSREAGGLSFTLEPTWGNAASGMAMLWRDGLAGGAAGAATGASSAWQAEGAPLADGRASPTAGRLQMELDYAIVLADGGRVAPFGRWTAESGSARRLNVGVRLSVLEAATLDLFGEQVSGRAEPADRRLGLQAALRFR